jgi:hypothetical protein
MRAEVLLEFAVNITLDDRLALRVGETPADELVDVGRRDDQPERIARRGRGPGRTPVRCGTYSWPPPRERRRGE